MGELRFGHAAHRQPVTVPTRTGGHQPATLIALNPTKTRATVRLPSGKHLRFPADQVQLAPGPHQPRSVPT